MADTGCVFCRIIKKELPAKVVFENEKVLAFEDLKPQAPIHIIIVPKQHIPKVSDLEEDTKGLAGELVLTANAIAARKGIDKSGYRIVINCNRDGGQLVFHLHLHLLGGRTMAWPPG